MTKSGRRRGKRRTDREWLNPSPPSESHRFKEKGGNQGDQSDDLLDLAVRQ